MTMSRPPLPDSYEGLLNRAQVAFRSGDTEGAIALYRRVVEKLGQMSDRVMERRPALRDLQRQARLDLTGLLHLEGRFAEAIEITEVLLQTHPDEADTWRRDLAVLRIEKGEVETGLAELRALAEEKPGEPGRWLSLGREAHIEGHFAESQSILERALEVARQEGDPGPLAEIHFERFRLFKKMGRLDDAIAAWEAAVSYDSEVSNTVREVVTMLTDAGRYAEALRYVARDDNAIQAGLQRGLIASLTGKPVEAQQEWQRVADMDPTEVEYGHDAWVESVLRLGDPIPALQWLQEFLPQYGTVRLFILSGIAWAMEGDQELASILFQQAINLLRRARPPKKKLDSADWHLLDSLVDDDESKTALKPYFAVVETLWG